MNEQNLTPSAVIQLYLLEATWFEAIQQKILTNLLFIIFWAEEC